MKTLWSFIRRAIILAFFGGIIIVLLILKNNPDVCEAYTRTVARGYGKFVSSLSSLVPISLTEVAFAIMGISIAFLLVMAIILLVKRKYFGALKRIVDGVIIVVMSIAIYDFSCELAYNRYEMPLPYYTEQVDSSKFIEIYNTFADDLNYCCSQIEFKEDGDIVQPLEFKDIVTEVKKAYAIVDDPYFHSHFGSVKPMASSIVYREFQITGVTYSPLGEANVDILTTRDNLPLTTAHELAHTKGVMREDDANKLAFYVCLNSDHYYLRFSAYMWYFYQIRAIVGRPYLKTEEQVGIHSVDQNFYKCQSFYSKYWDEHDLLGKIGDFINDLYIKSSGVEEGTSSYSGGTHYDYDETTEQLIASPYQQLYFDRYFNKLSV